MRPVLRRALFKFSGEQPHHDIVMPFAADEGGLALTSFFDESASAVTAYRPDVVGDDAQADPMQFEKAESVAHRQADGFASVAGAQFTGIVEPDRQLGAPVARVERVESDFAQKSSV